MGTDDAGQRHRVVVTQCQVGLATGFVDTSAQDLEQELGGLFSVLAGDDLESLERGGLQRVESVAFEDLGDGGDGRPSAPQVVCEEVPRS